MRLAPSRATVDRDVRVPPSHVRSTGSGHTTAPCPPLHWSTQCLPFPKSLRRAVAVKQLRKDKGDTVDVEQESFTLSQEPNDDLDHAEWNH